jgi:hypothetical protein
MTFDHRRSLRNLPLALAICFGIDMVHAAVRGLPVLDSLALAQFAGNLVIAGVIAGFSGLGFKGRRA